MSSFDQHRRQVVDACHRLHAKGLAGEAGGSFSCRIPGREAMALVPAGSDLATVEPQQVQILGFDLQALEGQGGEGGDRAVHATIYRLRPDAGAIAHTHQRWASGLRLLDEPMPGIFDEQVRQLGRSLQRLPYSAPTLGPEALARLRQRDNAYLFGDGVLCLGVTRERAIFNAELIEKCAKAYLLAQATGLRVGTVPLWVREIAHRRMLKDQDKAAKAYRRGEVPAGFTAY